MTPVSSRIVSDREFVLEHTFKAPAAKVFAAYTDPKLVPLWWAPKGGSLRVETIDARPGGSYRYHQRMPDGQEMVFSGRYLEVQPFTRLVYTFLTEGMPGSEIRATAELRESDGATHLTLTNLCGTKEQRDAMVNYGAAAGAKAAWDRLSEVLNDG
jgi:uncharacterized protein YndB with AHSA1/START domain